MQETLKSFCSGSTPYEVDDIDVNYHDSDYCSWEDEYDTEWWYVEYKISISDLSDKEDDCGDSIYDIDFSVGSEMIPWHKKGKGSVDISIPTVILNNLNSAGMDKFFSGFKVVGRDYDSYWHYDVTHLKKETRMIEWEGMRQKWDSIAIKFGWLIAKACKSMPIPELIKGIRD